MSMQQKVIEFTNLLRKSGVRVSVAEAIDAFSALRRSNPHMQTAC